MFHWGPAFLILALAKPPLIATQSNLPQGTTDPLIPVNPTSTSPCVATPQDSDGEIEPLIPIIFGISSIDRRFPEKGPCLPLPLPSATNNPSPATSPSLTTGNPVDPVATTQSPEQIRKYWENLFKPVEPTTSSSLTTGNPVDPVATTQSPEQIRKYWENLFKTVEPTTVSNVPEGTTVESVTTQGKEVSTTGALPTPQVSIVEAGPVMNVDVPVEQGARGCQCVPYYLCKNNSIVTDGEKVIEVRFFPGFGEENVVDRISSSQKPPCPSYLDVCCDGQEVLDRADQITPPPTTRKGCGQRNANGLGLRIVGNRDNEAQFGEFPWMVAVLEEQKFGLSTSNLSVYVCGGALIHWRVVLTAAHCVKGKPASGLTIRAGEWDTRTRNELYPHQDRRVESIIIHEKYHELVLYNDFALLILTEPVYMAPNVDILCLPQPGEDFDGSRCFTSGWGKDIFGKEERYQVILKKVDVPWVPHDVCEASLRQTRLGKYFVLDDTFVCAGGEIGKDACKGDGGGPLVCPLKKDPSRYVHAGIVAWGIGCGNAWPGVYANVASARLWIDQKMADNNLDSSVYQY